VLSAERIDLLVGTRPEAIKMVPVARALAAAGVWPRLILTGQHPLDPLAYHLDIFDRIALNCPGGGDPFGHADAVRHMVLALLQDDPPALLAVHGDTSSALGGALAAEALGIPLAHVEAGLRTFDPLSPWPEEENRVAIDRRAELLLAPTEGNAANLRAEGVRGLVRVTGNSGIDALLADLPPPAPRPPSPPRLLVTCHRRENWGEPMRQVALALTGLARRRALEITVVLHPNPEIAEAMRAWVGAGIDLIEPLDHPAMIAAIRASDVVLSDSGGMQEECPALGVPLLVLRDKTERPEGLASGTTLLVGTDRERIVATVLRLLDPAAHAAMARVALPFGDGHAAARIAAAMLDHLASRRAAFRRA
jgi:UDP-N-acetylglucosamine 2-epimerase (non-hydrolysing)